jgi:phosphoglycolate phosphatase
VPDVAGYAASQVEIVAALPLRSHLQLRDGDSVELAAAEVPGVRAVVFDVDGTLVNSIEGMWLAASRAAALYGFTVPDDAVRRSLNYGESLWEAIIPADVGGDSELPSILRMETMRHWPRVLADSVDVFDGLETTLDRLAAAGLRLAIYTGSRGESFLPLERAGLMRHFDPVITASDVVRSKPHPEGLLLCLERLGCAAGAAVYVGDSRHDVEAGRAAGMATIGVLTGAADSALLSAAGATRLAASHAALPGMLLPGSAAAGLR